MRTFVIVTPFRAPGRHFAPWVRWTREKGGLALHVEWLGLGCELLIGRLYSRFWQLVNEGRREERRGR